MFHSSERRGCEARGGGEKSYGVRGNVVSCSQHRCSFSLSRRKVVRRASLSDRTNLYRKECEKEAIVWQQLGAAEEGRNSGLIGEIGETRSDQENTDPVRNLFCIMGVTEEGW